MNKDKNSILKKIGIYTVFNLLFGVALLLIALIIIIIVGLPFYVKTGEIPEILAYLAYLLIAIILIVNECFTSRVTKKILKNEQNFCCITFYSTLVKSIIFTIIIYLGIFGFNSYKTSSFNSLMIVIVLICLFKFFAYIITTKFALKEKIETKKKYIFIGYILLITVILNLQFPTSLNRLLNFNSGQFSSLELENQVIENYNKYKSTPFIHNSCQGSGKIINYTHKFTEEELKCFRRLELTTNFTTKDMENFDWLNNLYIHNVEMNETIDLSNMFINELVIADSIFVNLDSKLLKNVTTLGFKNVKVLEKSVNINDTNLETICINNVEANQIFITNNKHLENLDVVNSSVSKLIFDNNPKVELSSNKTEEYMVENEGKKETTIYKLRIDKVENIEFKNVDDIQKLLLDSNITFNSMLLNNGKLYVSDRKYLSYKDNKLLSFNEMTIEDIKVDNLIIKKNEEKNIFEIYNEQIKLFEYIDNNNDR